MVFDVQKIRGDFPILKRRIHGRPLVYLDSAATSQKPKQMIAAMKGFMERSNANVHRGIHSLSEEATEYFEGARQDIARFINAPDANEVIFVRGTTEAINLVAGSWGRVNVKREDEILISIMEHHANMVPWQELAKEKGAKMVYAGITKDGRLDLADFKRKLSRRTKIVALTHVSNVLGTINPISDIGRIIKNHNSKFKIHNSVFLVDAAQSIPHLPLDVQKLGCDFLAFSGHKMYGPTGIGALWGKRELLEAMPPYQTGGSMIRSVSIEQRATWNDLPIKFEAGTPAVVEAQGLGEAVRYLEKIGMKNVRRHEEELLRYALRAFSRLNYTGRIRMVEIYGPKDTRFRSGLISFNVRGVHPHDVASWLDQEGIAVRAGHHCAMPLHKYFGLDATCRVSFGVYNTKDDVDKFMKALERLIVVFSPTRKGGLALTVRG